jgi:uncharacterized membrane protein HdeD (DUF308 family)
MLDKLRQNKFIWRRLVMLGAFLLVASLLSVVFAFSHDRPACQTSGCSTWDDIKQALPIAYAWAAGLWAFYGILAFASYFAGLIFEKIFKR